MTGLVAPGAGTATATPPLALNTARKCRTASALERFEQSRAAWFAAMTQTNDVGRRQSQLTALGSHLAQASAVVAEGVAALDTGWAPGDLYEECARVDGQTAWLQRLFTFYRERLEQRRTPEVRLLLDAADDVAWSCYRPMAEQLVKTLGEGTVGPTPLPVLEHAYAPGTANFQPREVVRDGDLADALHALPFPIVHLPAETVENPFWLVFMAHEVGHILQTRFALTEPFANAIADGVRKAGGDLDDQRRWQGWSREIFADTVSLMLVGTAGLRGLVEFERARLVTMQSRRQTYPAPAVRLGLVASLADRAPLSLDPTAALEGLEPAEIVKGSVEAAHDLTLVAGIAAAALQAFDIRGKDHTLGDLLGFERGSLLDHDLDGPENLGTARRVARVMFDRWAEARRTKAEPDRAAAESALAQEMLAVFKEKRLPGERAGEPASGPASDGFRKILAHVRSRTLAAEAY